MSSDQIINQLKKRKANRSVAFVQSYENKDGATVMVFDKVFEFGKEIIDSLCRQFPEAKWDLVTEQLQVVIPRKERFYPALRKTLTSVFIAVAIYFAVDSAKIFMKL